LARSRWASYWVVASALVLGLLAVAYAISEYVREVYVNDIEHDLIQRARMMAGSLEQDPGGGSARISSVELIDRLQNPQLNAVVFDDSGAVIGQSHTDIEVPSTQGLPEILAARDSGQGVSVRFETSLGVKVMYAAVEMRDGGIVRIGMPLFRLAADMLTIRLRLLTFVIVGSVIGLGLLWFGKNMVTAPDAVKATSAGAVSDDVTALNAMVRDMGSKLQERINEVVVQRNEYQSVLESISDGVVALNLDGIVLTMNQSAGRLLGLVPEQVRGQPLSAAIDNERILQVFTKSLVSDEALESEFVLDLPERRTLRCIAAPLIGTDEQRTGVVAVLDDVTRLRKLEQARKEFVANVSHELKTPITTIKGFVETLLDGALDERAEAQRFLSIVNRNTDRLITILDDLLQLSKLEMAEMEIKKTPLDLAHVARKAISFCEPRATMKNIRLDVTTNAIVAVRGDEALLEYAVVNLVDNAIKYSPPDTVIRVRVATEDEWASCWVEDEGDGIEASHLSRIFEPFYRVDKARSTKKGGTGLGLSVVRHIAGVHHGEVGVDSIPGQGSTFRIKLPLNL